MGYLNISDTSFFLLEIENRKLEILEILETNWSAISKFRIKSITVSKI